ncbi:leucine-rich repeat-containing protein 57-like [Ylistrum balloti]|uniref:leucine-rich repeat-containing protein 57-like n=1 Tax=Ylistrum balloti TaxID=509963 RepID=UPI0029059579|nr:leucine-rich repeat-containing protein 57-like [Ylistrum balloti]
MGNSNIKQHIDTAQKTGACQLCKLGLKEFPEDLQRLTKNLRTLDLSENKIPLIPPVIGSFSLLKNVNLSKNRLESLPAEFGNLKKLESLSLESNCLTSIPESLTKLASLRTLNLSDNRLKSFPKQVCVLRQLDALDLSKNKITVLPDDLEQCQAIELNLNQNQISGLPESLTSCPRLKVLRVEENCLEISAFSPRIMKESNIALLAVEGNVFDMKAFNNLDGYDEYMERYTATKKKFN